MLKRWCRDSNDYDTIASDRNLMKRFVRYYEKTIKISHESKGEERDNEDGKRNRAKSSLMHK